MRELSVFCDERGDFGALSNHSPYYLVGLVLHDQADSIDSQVASFYDSLAARGMAGWVPVHTAPLIRREERYAHLDGSARKKLFDVLFTFFPRCPVACKVVAVDKRMFGIGSDLACTMEHVDLRRRERGLTKSECPFFGGSARFAKTCLKVFRKKCFEGNSA